MYTELNTNGMYTSFTRNNTDLETVFQ